MRSVTNNWTVRAMLGLTLLCVGILLHSNSVTAACTQTTDFGKVTFEDANTSSTAKSVNVPAGTYRVWSRVQTPNTANNNYMLEIDGTCYIVGGSGFNVANTWTWVDFQTNGSKLNVTFSTSGTHTIKMYGTSDAFLLDRIIFADPTSSACSPPTDKGDACAAVTNAAPTVSMTSSVASGTAPLNVTLTATASDSDGTISKVEFFNGTTSLGTGTQSGSTYTKTITGLAAGTYNYTAKATDNNGAVTTSTPVKTVTVTAPTTQKPGDANGDGAVNALDLNVFSFNYGKSGMTFAQGDFNGDGTINALDVNILSFNWGK